MKAKYLTKLVLLFVSLISIASCKNKPTFTPERITEMQELQQLVIATPDLNKISTQEIITVENPISDVNLPCQLPEGQLINDSWVHLFEEFPNVSHMSFINDIQGDSGGVWLATDGLGISYFNGETWKFHQPETRDDMKNDAFRRFAVNGDFAYANTTEGIQSVYIYDRAKDQWVSFDHENNFPTAETNTVAIDPSGNVNYLLNEKQKDKLEIGTWLYMPFSVYSLGVGDVDNNGALWKAAPGMGLGKFSGEDWEAFAVGNGYLLSNNIVEVAIDSQGNVWAASQEGLSFINPIDNKATFFPREQFPLGEFWMVDIEIDSQDRLWFVTKESVSIYDGEKWGVITADSLNLPFGFGNALGFDPNGCVWIEAKAQGIVILTQEISLK